MTDTKALLELAARCEEATGADREIDRDIGLAMNVYDRPEDLGCFSDPARAVVSGGGQTFAAPAFTASLDAALTLVPEGWDYDLSYLHGDGSCVPGYAEISPSDTLKASDFHKAEAATPALALCAASLRAIAQEQSK